MKKLLIGLLLLFCIGSPLQAMDGGKPPVRQLAEMGQRAFSAMPNGSLKVGLGLAGAGLLGAVALYSYYQRPYPAALPQVNPQAPDEQAINPESVVAPKTPLSLKNFGNSCYCNASLQLLAASTLSELVKGKENLYKKEPLAQGLVQLLSAYKAHNGTKVNDLLRPYFQGAVRNKLGCGQQDAGEFLVRVMDGLERSSDHSLNRLVKEHCTFTEQTTIHDNPPRMKQQDSTALTLPLFGNSLFDCLNEYFKPEMVELYGVECEKVTQLTKLPKTWVISLGRFDANLKKRKDAIAIPLSFNTSAIDKSGILGNQEYQLQSIVCHRGEEMRSGHYVAYVKRDQQWFLANDEIITEVTADEVVQATAKTGYVMVYEKN